MVSEHHQGLRFDIYERVHLPDGVYGIKELDEVELVPHIQVLSHEDQAILKGNLLLSGRYVDEQGAGGRTLEHLIPVEISLPLSRVNRVEDISVDIENFDVDLLSTRSLNVTGVLSLNGVEVLSSGQEQESWHTPDEEVVFIHEAPYQQDGSARSELANSKKKSGNAKPVSQQPQVQEPVNPQFEAPYNPQFNQQLNPQFNPQLFNQEQFQPPQFNQEQFQQHQLQQEQLYNQMLNEQAQHQANLFQQHAAHSPQPPYHPLFDQQTQEQEHSAPNQMTQQYPHYYEQQVHPLLADGTNEPGDDKRDAEEPDYDELQEEALDASAEPAEDAPEDEPVFSAGEAQSDEKKEMKIAFGSKPNAQVPEEAKPVGLQSLLSASKAQKNAQREQELAQQPEVSPQDAIEWKKLLLSSKTNQQQFRKMKLCIVQKDETLESIAKRYEVNPREIALLNRLTENEVRAGQIVHIPK